MGNILLWQNKGKFRKNVNKLEADPGVNSNAEQRGMTKPLWRLSISDQDYVTCILLTVKGFISLQLQLRSLCHVTDVRSDICSKNSLCNMPWKPRGRVEFSFTLSLTLSLDRGRWSMPHLNCFTPGKVTWYPLYRRLGGAQSQSGWVSKISQPPGFDSRTI
jgi:hypothetical protein